MQSSMGDNGGLKSVRRSHVSSAGLSLRGLAKSLPVEISSEALQEILVI
jgi:hypothetical protein